MIQVEKLSKRYGELRAVDAVSFEVRKGELYGLLGPNGAGKTTTMSMLAGLLAPDEGRILFDGIDLAAIPLKVKAQLGVVPQEPALYESCRPARTCGSGAGSTACPAPRSRAPWIASSSASGSPPRQRPRRSTYSGGMKRRLNLGLGLVHARGRPDGRADGRDRPPGAPQHPRVGRRVAAAGRRSLYTTHYLEEAETLCDRIAIMDHGKILAEGTLDELKRRVGGREVVTVRGAFDGRGRAEPWRRAIRRADRARAESRPLRARGRGGRRRRRSRWRAILGRGLAVDGCPIQPPSLNTLFLNLTGRELRD